MISRILNTIIKHATTIGLGLLLITTALSLIPLPQLPEVPGTDKTHHFIAYGSVSFFMSISRSRQLFVYLLCVVLWSGVIELIQPYVNRYGEWMDFMANALGVLIGLVTATFFKFTILKK